MVAEKGVSDAEKNAMDAFNELNYEHYSLNNDHAWINELKIHLTSFKKIFQMKKKMLYLKGFLR